MHCGNACYVMLGIFTQNTCKHHDPNISSDFTNCFYPLSITPFPCLRQALLWTALSRRSLSYSQRLRTWQSEKWRGRVSKWDTDREDFQSAALSCVGRSVAGTTAIGQLTEQQPNSLNSHFGASQPTGGGHDLFVERIQHSLWPQINP